MYSASISSPKNSMRIASSSYIGMISTVSPRTRNVPRTNAVSLRSYCISTKRRSKSSRSTWSPTFSSSIRSTYSCGVPRPKMQLTEATTTVSRRVSSEFVALWRRRSTSALMAESFSM